MRKGLTNKQIEAKLKAGRGQGTGKTYQPFIKVHEIASRGRSHRVLSHKTSRLHHLLSDLELMVFLSLEWDTKVIDIREQYPLPQDKTIAIAAEAGITHHIIDKTPQVVTTDFLVDYGFEKNHKVALSAKYSDDFEDPRTIEKLEIERRYWKSVNIEWFLITEKQVSKVVSKNIDWIYSALNCEVDNEELINNHLLLNKYFNENPSKLVTEITKIIDLTYQLENGESLTWFRHLLAHRLFSFDISKPLAKLTASEVIYTAHVTDILLNYATN